jgi:hypothetical protein
MHRVWILLAVSPLARHAWRKAKPSLCSYARTSRQANESSKRQISKSKPVRWMAASTRRSYVSRPTPILIEVAHSLLGRRELCSESSTLAEAFALIRSFPPSAQQFGKFFFISHKADGTCHGPLAVPMHTKPRRNLPSSCAVPQHAAQNFPGRQFGKQRLFIHHSKLS